MEVSRHMHRIGRHTQPGNLRVKTKWKVQLVLSRPQQDGVAARPELTATLLLVDRINLCLRLRGRHRCVEDENVLPEIGHAGGSRCRYGVSLLGETAAGKDTGRRDTGRRKEQQPQPMRSMRAHSRRRQKHCDSPDEINLNHPRCTGTALLW